MIFLSQTVAPDAWITTAECKANMRVDHSDEDDFISALASAACRAVDARTGKAIGAQTWALSLYGLSSDAMLRLPVFPATAISSITYYDADDAEQSLTVSDFYLFGDDDGAYIQPKDGTSWPDTMDRPDAVTITFTAGMTPTQTMKQAALLLVSHWYENRSATTEEQLRDIPEGVDSLIGLDRKGWVGA